MKYCTSKKKVIQGEGEEGEYADKSNMAKKGEGGVGQMPRVADKGERGIWGNTDIG